MNIFGNNPPSEFPQSNCGTSNFSGDRVIATNNFWGADTGPGPDPADQACNVNGATITTPFSLTEFRALRLPQVE